MKLFTYKKDKKEKEWIINSGSITIYFLYFKWIIANELWYYDVNRLKDEPSRIYHYLSICRERSLVQDDLPLILITLGPLRFYLGWLK